MVRCHTKGVYFDDEEAKSVSRFRAVAEITRRLKRAARKRTDGFARVSPRMAAEYFGGMYAHLSSAYRVLKPGGTCAYVVCDQQSLLGVYINTPQILAHIAKSRRIGFQFIKAVTWKQTRGSTGKRMLSERIIILRKPDR